MAERVEPEGNNYCIREERPRWFDVYWDFLVIEYFNV